MKNSAGKLKPTASHGRSQFTEKNPSGKEAGRCLLSLDQWRYFVSDCTSGCPCWVVCGSSATRGIPKNYRMPKGRSVHLPSWSHHSGHNPGRMAQAVMRESLTYFFSSRRPRHFSTRPRCYQKCTWGQHLDIPNEGTDLTLLGAASTIEWLVPQSSTQSPNPVLQRFIHVFNLLNMRQMNSVCFSETQTKCHLLFRGETFTQTHIFYNKSTLRNTSNPS